MNEKVYILLGSNLGDREGYLNKALDEMSRLPEVEIIRKSGLYNSPAMEMSEPAPDFLNQVVEIRTPWSPWQLLQQLKAIEISMGRTGKGKYQSRTIDLDILLFEELILNANELTIPQTRLLKRPFALVPLVEIAPDFIHPVTKKAIREHLQPIDFEIVIPYEEHASTTR